MSGVIGAGDRSNCLTRRTVLYPSGLCGGASRNVASGISTCPAGHPATGHRHRHRHSKHSTALCVAWGKGWPCGRRQWSLPAACRCEGGGLKGPCQPADGAILMVRGGRGESGGRTQETVLARARGVGASFNLGRYCQSCRWYVPHACRPSGSTMVALHKRACGAISHTKL